VEPIADAPTPTDDAAATDTASTAKASSDTASKDAAPTAKAPLATASRPLEGAKKAHATPEARAEAERKARERGLDQGGPFDPIKENGQYFVGWKKPRLALVISGRQDGYIEPCGCAGLEKQLGGLSRRMAFFQDLKKRGWSVAAVDVGGVVRRFGKQAELQFGITAEAYKTMHYDGVGFGPADLRLSAGEIVAAVAGAEPADSIFVAANVSLFDLTPKVRIVEAGGMKLGITSVIGKSYQAEVNNSEVVITPADEAVAEVLPQLQDCDVKVLLAQASYDESLELAKKFTEFDLVVTAGGADVPPAQPEKVPGGKGRLIEVGHKGQYLVVAGFFADAKEPVRFQRVALDSRYPNTAEMKALMVTYQDQLQSLGWEGLGLKPVPAPQTKRGEALSGKFVGSASCKECHESAFEVWNNSAHAHATDTLVNLDPPRQYDAECISCHATGWNAQENSPYVSGFESLDKTPHLVANGCENCHGPGAAHVAAETKGDDAARDAARALLHLTWAEAKENQCVQCHDHDNSPEFANRADEYWSEIEH
jgi:hypothetical protein